MFQSIHLDQTKIPIAASLMTDLKEKSVLVVQIISMSKKLIKMFLKKWYEKYVILVCDVSLTNLLVDTNEKIHNQPIHWIKHRH